MSSLNPKITIITICYNAKDYIENTIKSVISQTYHNIEYIIIDGASSDGTIEIIKKYEKEIACFISEPDKGIYDAMNKGIDKSTGEWINFMNAGDTFTSKDIIESIFTNQYTEDVLYSDTTIVDASGKIVKQLEANSLTQLFKPEMPFIHQSVFVKTNLLKQFPFRTDYSFASDLDFFIKIYVKGYKFKYLSNMVISNFLFGGIHTNNMIKYIAEGTNSLLSLHPNIKSYHENLGVVNAFEDLNNSYQESSFPHNLSKALANIEKEFSSKSNILIYGYGLFGKLLYSHYKNKIIGVIDNNINYKKDINIITTSEIMNYNFDYIFISLLGREKEIKQTLLSNKVPLNKIIVLS